MLVSLVMKMVPLVTLRAASVRSSTENGDTER